MEESGAKFIGRAMQFKRVTLLNNDNGRGVTLNKTVSVEGGGRGCRRMKRRRGKSENHSCRDSDVSTQNRLAIILYNRNSNTVDVGVI